ncbi:MAG TPA: GNAT family N-acetyltransferase [Myxococcales bacterium]|nr:GNAT family N-acetyltransferase [Myxococcales bacterium]
MELVRVEGPGPALEQARALLAEYWSSFGFTPCFQGFDREMAALPGAYAPPRGTLLLLPGQGCVAVRPLDAETAEMKRLYLRPQARGSGLGRALASAAIAHARACGFARMVLDTMPEQMALAVGLYRSMGFREAPPYLAEPTPGALCLELPLR